MFKLNSTMGLPVTTTLLLDSVTSLSVISGLIALRRHTHFRFAVPTVDKRAAIVQCHQPSIQTWTEREHSKGVVERRTSFSGALDQISRWSWS